MKINVTLLGSLSRYMHNTKVQTLDFPESTTAQEMLDIIGIPSEYCSFVMVNGIKVSRKSELSNGDEVVIFPLVSGG